MRNKLRIAGMHVALPTGNKAKETFFVLAVTSRQNSAEIRCLQSVATSDAHASVLAADPAMAGVKIQTILAPTDLSSASKAGVGYALGVAKELDARVIVYHVITAKEIAEFGRKRQAGAFVAARFNGLMEIYQSRLRQFLKRNFADHLRSINVESKVGFGTPETSIVASAKTDRADAIIMSSSRRGRFANWLLGSVTERIVRNAPCPVLVIPTDSAVADENASTKQRPDKTPALNRRRRRRSHAGTFSDHHLDEWPNENA
jgi:nucleotide-binding universal stress UspA family protein